MGTLSFTTPALLWGLAATSLPLLIHLINRHRARRRKFAAMDFLERVQRRSARRILLRHLLLLVCRTLLIAVLVLAAAGPVLREERAPDTRPSATTALVIDCSLSMRTRVGDTTFFGLAQERARALIQQMAPGDRLCLLSAGLTVEPRVSPCTDSRRTLLDALEALKPQAGRSNLTEAIDRATAILREGKNPSPQRVLLLTDAAAHAFAAPPAPAAGEDPMEVVLENVSPDTPRANHAVLGVTLDPTSPDLEVQARIGSFSEEREAAVPAEVLLDKQRLARVFVDLDPGATATKVFNLPWPSAAESLGVVQLAADRLSEDDARAFFVSGRRGVRALLVNGDLRPVLQQDELFYLERALAPGGEAGVGIGFTTLTPERLSRGALDNIEVVFLANVQDLPQEAIVALRAFVAAGGGLFVAIGNHVDVDRTNQQLQDLLPWPLRDLVSLGAADPDGEHRQGIGLTDFDFGHPVFALFSGDKAAALSNVRAWRAAVVEPGQAAQHTRVLARYQNGAPALLEGGFQKGRVLLWTSTLDRDWSSWPARASFLPFLQRATLYLAGRLTAIAPPEVTVGDPVAIPFPLEADGILIQRPDGQKVELGPSERRESRALFRETTALGYYAITLTAGGKALGHAGSFLGFLVHPPASESDLKPIAISDLQAQWGNRAHLQAGGIDDGHARSQTLLLLLMALLLVLVEAVLVRR